MVIKPYESGRGHYKGRGKGSIEVTRERGKGGVEVN
jgi:hypothetical protein